MSVFWNKRVKTLLPYVPGEQPRAKNIIKLNTNENPYPPSPRVIEAIKAAAGDRLRLYPDPSCEELRTAIAERYHLDISEVFAANGSDEALAFAFGAFFESGVPPLLFPDITYSFYPVYANLWNIPFEQIPLRDDFSICVDDYEKECGGVIFPNPNAPTGRALGATETIKLAKSLAKKNKVLIVDEAYFEFGAESVVPYIKENPNLLTVHTLSKSASLAGLRCGFAIGPRPLVEALEHIRDSFNSYTVDALAQAGAAAAIRDRDYYQSVNQKIINTRDRIAAELGGLGFTVIPSKANFIFIKPPQIPAAKLFQILRENNIIARHFDKPRAADYLRVSVGTDAEMDAFMQVVRR